MSAIILNLVVIAVIVAGWTAAVWAFYTRLDEGRARAGSARSREVTGAGSLPATRQDVRRAA
ncbi:MAG TPA: hypothetical protein VFO01_03440 [Trebonia sp.]|nr:hypothetical protein [Trebonia sp.]